MVSKKTQDFWITRIDNYGFDLILLPKMASALSKRVIPCVNAGVYHARDNQADQESLIVHFTCGT